MAAHIEIEGLKEIRRDLKRYSPELNKALNKNFKELVKKVVVLAQNLSPKLQGEMPPGRTAGALAKGIKPVVTQSTVAITSKAPHARIFEFGGRHPVFGNDTWVFQPKMAYLFPAVDQSGSDVSEAAEQALEQARREAGFK